MGQESFSTLIVFCMPRPKVTHVLLSGCSLRHVQHVEMLKDQLVRLDLQCSFDFRFSRSCLRFVCVCVCANRKIMRSLNYHTISAICEISSSLVLDVSFIFHFSVFRFFGFCEISRDFQDNRLTQLPASIAQFQQLSALSLSDNQLGSLPESFGTLARLKWLNIASNHLTSLPDLSGLVSLVEFYICGLRTLSLVNFADFSRAKKKTIEFKICQLRCCRWRV
jgi:hypothetical protein